jgi:hypothetical protein
MTTKPAEARPKLLSGGNPQIPKGDGDAPVQAYIAAMPGWTRGVGRRLDALIERTGRRPRAKLLISPNLLSYPPSSLRIGRLNPQ